jgi:hypothetical protein
MAKLEINGTVEKVFYEGKAASVTESYKDRDGKDQIKRYTAWFKDPHGLDVGDTVSVQGLHSAQIDEWTDEVSGEIRRAAKVALNNARILKVTKGVNNDWVKIVAPPVTREPDLEVPF